MKQLIPACAFVVGLAWLSLPAAAGELAFVSNEKDNTVSVLDMVSLKLIKTILFLLNIDFCDLCCWTCRIIFWLNNGRSI